MRSTFMHELWAVPGLYRATTAVTKDFFVFVLEIFVGFFVMWDAGGGGVIRGPPLVACNEHCRPVLKRTIQN